MTDELSDKTAIVTGGSRGIGQAIVRRLAASGARIVFGYRADDRAAAEVREATGAIAVRADMGELADVRRLFEHADEWLGPLDILVNNAGYAAMAPIAETSEADYDRMMAVHAKGTFFALRYATSRLRDHGRVINVSTMNTAWPSPGEAVYAASKAAVEQFTRVASRELGGRGITVNTVSPGPTDTDLLRGAVSEDVLDGIAGMTALGRVGTPADVAELVAFLAGPTSGWVTGQNIRADGGLV